MFEGGGTFSNYPFNETAQFILTHLFAHGQEIQGDKDVSDVYKKLKDWMA